MRPGAAGPGTGGDRDRALSAGLVGVLALLGLLVTGGVAVDVVLPPEPVPAAEPVAQPPARAGAWYCPVTAGRGEGAVLSIASVGKEPSEVVVTHHGGEGPVDDPPVVVAPGDEHQVELPPGLAGLPTTVSWRGGPAVVTWQVVPGAGEGGARPWGGDAGAAPCVTGPAARWHVAGLDTSGGTTSLLHLFNPFAEDAVARIVFATPEGRVALVLTESILVPAGRALPLDLSEYQPEQSELGAVVEVRTGRLVMQGEVRYDPPGERAGTTGRALLPGAPAAALEWALGYARADGQGDSWLSIVNPGEREAAVELRVSDPRPEGPALLGEIAVPPGAVVRVDLNEVSAAPEFGVGLAVVNDVPVVAARITDLHLSDGRRGVAASLAAIPGSEWALAGAGTAGRSSVLGLYNPGPAPVQVEVLAAGTPLPEASALVVPPNARVAVDLAAVGEHRGLGVRVRADGPVVPELRVLSAGAPLRAWTVVAVPAEAWTGPGSRPFVLHDPRLATSPVAPTEAARTFEPAPGAAPLPAATSAGPGTGGS